MKLKSFKEKDKKKLGIIIFTVACIMLITGVVIYRTFAIFEVQTNQNVIHGNIQSMGDIEFAFYIDDKIDKNVPEKDSGYTLNTETSKCIDISTGEQTSNISWDHEKWEAHLKNITTTKTKCYLYFNKLYVEEELNGAIPDLGNELVAITLDETNGSAKKANLMKDWYKYTEQRWANAVILKNKDDYVVGEEIPEENIESYFVWIPRYEYQLWNGEEETNKFNFTTLTQLDGIIDATQQNELNQQQFINIKFVNKNEPIVTGSTKNSWLTHPAFTSFDSNGFWVGKFETGYNQNEDVRSLNTKNWTKVNAETNVNKIASDRVVIKPNVYSWRNIDVSNAFYTVYNYKRELDSHMIKNMEWGAIAYLSNSKYGRCSGENCSEVRINNSGNFLTGAASKKEPTCGLTDSNDECNKYCDTNMLEDTDCSYNYLNKNSTSASTTGNYTGVYDLSGGSDEYVMGMMKATDSNFSPASGRNSSSNSGFKGPYSCALCDDGVELENTTGYEWPSSKYYDLYDYGTRTNYTRGHFGDATKEIGPMYSVKFSSNIRYVGSWYADVANFADKDYPWIRRGGNFSDGTDSGIFKYDFSPGKAASANGFRIVLTP